ncbi:MAG TPA: hypothetical protein VFV33_21815 [Gemmatimonadaceae bacterium]|nr:hypothetical protein [Gemmatimonadaceae bacterium]
MIAALLLFSRIIAWCVLGYAGLIMTMSAWHIATTPDLRWGPAGRYVVGILVSSAWLYATWGIQ